MKNALFVILLLNSVIGNTQTWCPNGAIWTYSFEPAFASGIYRYEYIDDTIINTINCKVIQKSVVSKIFSDPEYHTTIMENHILYADIDRVYFYYNNQFNLLYDFSVQVGDTMRINGITLSHWPNTCDSIAVLRVDTVGTVNINSETLRFYSVHTVSGSPLSWDCRIVEKIGPYYNYGNYVNNYFFPYKSDGCGFVTNEESEGGNFKCYRDGSFNAVSLSFDSCSFALGVENEEINNFKFYPNPVINDLSISFNDFELKTISIYNSNGQIIFKEKTSSEVLRINLENYTSGIYLIEYQNEKGNRSVKKFIKE